MLITNFREDRRPIYEKVLSIYKEKTEDKSLYLDRNAYDRRGRKIEGYNALRCTEHRDLQEFWNVFASIESCL